MSTISPVQKARAAYRPKLPAALAESGPFVKLSVGEPTESVADRDDIKAKFPNTYGLPLITIEGHEAKSLTAIKVGVILSGGQAPGGHNVIAGLYDALKAANPGSELYGFLGGPSGLIDKKFVVLTDELMDSYRNTGGFDIIGSGRTKLESEEQFAKVAANCQLLGITAVVVIGGDDSNTNACMLAEYFCRTRAGIQVIGCPKTIDGDLKNEWIETSFGFDTATKVYAELIGNIQRDANSAKKYWHFIKLMGRSASHIALEAGLKTHPNVCIVSEEVESRQMTLHQVAEEIAKIVAARAQNGRNFGIVLVPEGLVEFVPEVKALIAELNDLLGEHKAYFETLSDDDKLQFVNGRISPASTKTFGSLPAWIRRQLLADRDDHGNVQVSRIETEKLLIDLVGDMLREWKAEGKFGGKFSALSHFFGYEGRCAAPSNFDADYCYSLGYTASTLVLGGKTGYLAAVRNLTCAASQWTAMGVPLTMMMNMERRQSKSKPVIRKALVELDGRPFKELASKRAAWALEDDYVYPGPIQYFGPSEVCDLPTETLALEHLPSGG